MSKIIYMHAIEEICTSADKPACITRRAFVARLFGGMREFQNVTPASFERIKRVAPALHAHAQELDVWITAHKVGEETNADADDE